MNKLGREIFISDLKAFQIIDTKEQIVTTRTLVKPVRRFKRRLDRLLNGWLAVVGVAFGVLTVKIVIEQMVRLK